MLSLERKELTMFCKHWFVQRRYEDYFGKVHLIFVCLAHTYRAPVREVDYAKAFSSAGSTLKRLFKRFLVTMLYQ